MADEDNTNRRIYRNPYEFSIDVPPSSSHHNIHINVIPPPQIVNGYIISSPYHHMFLSSNTLPYHNHNHNHHYNNPFHANNYHAFISQAIANLHSQHAMNTQAVFATNNNYAVPPPPPRRRRRGFNLNAEVSDDSNSPQPEADQQEPQAAGGWRFDCNICLDSPREAVVTFCGHLFCWKCLYLSHCVRQECPVCKARLLRLQEVVVPVYGGAGARHDGASSSSRIPPRPRGRLLPATNNNNNDHNALDLFPM